MAEKMFEKIILGLVLGLFAFAVMPSLDDSAKIYAESANASTIGKALSPILPALPLVGVVVYFVYIFVSKK